MRYIRPFDIKAADGTWLLSPEEEAGCAIRLRHGPGAFHDDLSQERIALILSGNGGLAEGTGEIAGAGDLVFVPSEVAGTLKGDDDLRWIEIIAPLPPQGKVEGAVARVAPVDHSKFEGAGFAYQGLIDRESGSASMRVNVLQVEPGAGSPDFHIHAFAQIYVIQEGEMTLDIGRQRLKAGSDSLVVLPAGVVHRNFNAASHIERHISLLVPEPQSDEIFDFAITIHENEAELLQQLPA